MKKFGLLVALCLMTMALSYAQEPSKAGRKVDEIVKKYDGVEGVECVTVVKGRGLELVKMMFSKQFGKDFMKGVQSITIIEYSKATAEVCQAMRKEIESFSSILTEFNLGEDKDFTQYNYIKSFASSVEDKAISDFITALEDKGDKMIMYMDGKIKVE